MTGSAETRETVLRFCDEVVRLIHVDIRQAERLARAAARVAKRIGDEGARAASLRATAHIFYVKRRYEKAWQHYDAALKIYERLGDQMEVGRTLSSSMQTLIYLGRYEEALGGAQKAKDIFSLAQNPRRLATLDNNMGNLLYRQDRFEEALERYQGAHAQFVRLEDHQNAAIALKNMATCRISLGEFRKSLETYRGARAYCEAHGLTLLAAEADYNIAYLYYLRGEYTRAIELYRATREHCHQLGDLYHQGLCDLDQSEMYLELNLSEEGAFLARRALETFRQLGMGYERAKSLTNLAIASSHHGDAEAALELFGKARDLFTREGNAVWTAMVDLYRALVFHQEGRRAEARALGEQALEFFAASPLAAKAALCELLLARIHLEEGRPSEAKKVCLAALDRLAAAETPAAAWQAWFVLGMVNEALAEPEPAYEAYLEAHRQMETLRSHLGADELKIAFLKDKLAVYESLVRMSLTRVPADREAAFRFMEEAKSRSLADLIAFRANGIPSSRAAERGKVEQINALREELNWFTRTIQVLEGNAASARDAQLERLRGAARDAERRLAAALTELRLEDQEYASLHATSTIDLTDIQAAIPADAVLVQYYRAGDTFYACLLSRNGLEVVPTGSAEELRRELQLLRFQLSKFRLGAEYVRVFQAQLLDAAKAHLQEFHRQLMAPILPKLEKAAHLIVAPHGFLHYLPFHALYDGERYLGSRFSISYAPSASVFYLCARKQADGENRSLVLGVPDDSAPHILGEAEAVSGVLPNAEVYMGEEATLEVLREKGSRARFVHIATHGRFRQDNPMFSSISLGRANLSLFDLYQLSLQAELVTLSGCGTGLNVVMGGDEQMGLKRGLLYAGAQALLLTLWDVNDQSTAEFMKLFYERMGTNGNKAEAVQFAMGEMRKRHEHPFYWAPFLLVGKYQ